MEGSLSRPPKKVLYVITKATWGGAQRYVYDLIGHARSYGYEPALVYGERGLLAERTEALGFATYQINSLGRDVALTREFKAQKELTELFRKVKPDVVHLNSSKAGYTGVRAAKKAGVPRIISTIHGWAFTEPRNWLIQTLFRWMQRHMVQDADVSIAVSDFVASFAKPWGLPKSKIVLIRHGIEAPSFLKKEAARAALVARDASLAGKEEEVWVGTIAELHRNKGIDVGIDGWKEAQPKGAQWIVIGGGEEASQLRARANEDPSIHLSGFIADAGIYLQAFDLFMLPSRTEALGYVLLEAAAAGVPCIASDFGGSREILAGSPANTLFASGNASSLAALLTTYLDDEDLRKKTGQALHQYVTTHFSLRRMLDATFEQY